MSEPNSNPNDVKNVLSSAEKSHIAEIETAVNELIADQNYENLAHVLTLVRKYIDTELIVAVKGGETGGLHLAPVKTPDGKRYFALFTSFDEQLKGPSKVQSTYEVSIRKMFDFVLQNNDIEGVIVNPWSSAFIVNKQMINIVLAGC